jgi:hypothetical protein
MQQKRAKVRISIRHLCIEFRAIFKQTITNHISIGDAKDGEKEQVHQTCHSEEEMSLSIRSRICQPKQPAKLD